MALCTLSRYLTKTGLVSSAIKLSDGLCFGFLTSRNSSSFLQSVTLTIGSTQ